MNIKIIEKLIEFIAFSLKVDANSVSTIIAYQPKIPKELKRFKNVK